MGDDDTTRRQDDGRLPIRGRVLLALAVAFHLSMLLSWRLGLWNRFTFDSTATHGRRGWDFYALYQAGRNVLTGVTAVRPGNFGLICQQCERNTFHSIVVSGGTSSGAGYFAGGHNNTLSQVAFAHSNVALNVDPADFPRSRSTASRGWCCWGSAAVGMTTTS